MVILWGAHVAEVLDEHTNDAGQRLLQVRFRHPCGETVTQWVGADEVRGDA